MGERANIFVFDIETAPMLAYVWQAKTDYVNPDAFTHESFMLSWAGKWAGGKRVYGGVLTPEEAKAQDDSRIIQDLADMIRSADIVVAHNGDRFDIPMLNNRLLLMGQTPLGPVRTIDTLKLARKSFRLVSNKLDYLARQLGVGRKIETSFDLWRRCYLGQSRALREMYRYNRRDVEVLEAVFDALKPHVRGLPRLVDGGGEGDRCCPFCGEDALQKRGFYRTNASTFRRFCCMSCNRWCRARSAEPSKKLANVPIL